MELLFKISRHIIGLGIAAGLFVNVCLEVADDYFFKTGNWDDVCQYCVENYINREFSESTIYKRRKNDSIKIQRLLRENISRRAAMANIKHYAEFVSYFEEEN